MAYLNGIRLGDLVLLWIGATCGRAETCACVVAKARPNFDGWAATNGREVNRPRGKRTNSGAVNGMQASNLTPGWREANAHARPTPQCELWSGREQEERAEEGNVPVPVPEGHARRGAERARCGAREDQRAVPLTFRTETSSPFCSVLCSAASASLRSQALSIMMQNISLSLVTMPNSAEGCVLRNGRADARTSTGR